MNFLTKILLRIIPKKARKTSSVKKTGYYRDFEDSRDHPLRTSFSSEEELPSRVSLKQYTSKVKQQGKANSCTGHASILAWEMSQRIAGKKENQDFVEASEAYAYREGRIDAKLYPQDAGCYIRNVLRMMNKKGVCPERMNPYNDKNINNPPRPFSDQIAGQFKIKEYHRLNDSFDIKNALNSKRPVIIGTPIYKDFFNSKSNKEGIKIPSANEKPTGAHAYTIIGYDDDLSSFLIQNSWGNWANNGFAWMPYDYLEQIDWFDAWTMTI